MSQDLTAYVQARAQAASIAIPPAAGSGGGDEEEEQEEQDRQDRIESKGEQLFLHHRERSFVVLAARSI
jgi:ribosomal protein L12E/L44/L45/RPP1/RPP2